MHAPIRMRNGSNPALRHSLVLILAVVTLSLTALAQPLAAPVQRILIVGDSWAMSITKENHDGFPSEDVFDKALAANGLGAYETRGEKTAWGGRKASDWVKPDNLAIIRAELEAVPTLDIVHLIIGGNDFLAAAGKEDFPREDAAARAMIWDHIVGDIRTIVEACLAVRPEIRVVIADYDYLDPTAANKFWKMDFHGADTRAVNGWFVELGKKKLALAEALDRCEYVQNWGTLQYWFGEPAKAVALPGQAPKFEPYPGGDASLGMPAVVTPDGIHPLFPGHEKLLQNAIDAVYAKWLKTGDKP